MSYKLWIIAENEAAISKDSYFGLALSYDNIFAFGLEFTKMEPL